ncbi:50S ribosomal subunit L30 [Mycena chlorophos]|uniref:Large ribosomal subunit protein mL46 n=1 Tax=Mycena chlorophos TaxID=658473 RepID=A0A8H6TSS5_MYCCL|nr:50S ribosomal subunit L30 [Mycena chlorophos]
MSRALSLTRSLATEVPLKRPSLYTAVILNRAPLLTPSPTPFENAFYAYQQRIRRALHNPFPTEFYFKPGSLLEAKFNSEERYRERVAWGPDYAKGDEIDEAQRLAEKAVLEQIELQEQNDEKLVSRVHPSDTARDYHSLDRKGRRNVYLLVKRVEEGAPKGVWEFPWGRAQRDELLHQAAARELEEKCGAHMDTWIVARKPIGMYKPPIPAETDRENITFFFKANIMAGQVRPGKSVTDFAWVTKQEVEKRVDGQYWESVKDMLSDH